MKIAFTSYEYLPHFSGGIGNYTRQAANMLIRRGHDVDVFSATPLKSYSTQIDGVNIHYISCHNRNSFSSAMYEAFRLQNSLNQYDVVECPDLGAEGFEIFNKLPKIPSVIRLHTPLFLASWIDRQSFGKIAVSLQTLRTGIAEVVRNRSVSNTKKFYRDHWSLGSSYDMKSDIECQTALKSNLLVSPSIKLASEISEVWNINKSNIRVVPYPHHPDPAWLKICKVRHEVKTISFYGGIKTFKGVDVLARAIPLILKKYPNIRFVFAGSPQDSPVVDLSLASFIDGRICKWVDMIPWLKHILRDVSNSIDFQGQLDRNGIAQLLEQADICVFPSLFDNFPNACLEAMAAARPVVATRSGGMEEMIGVSRGGLLVEPGKVHELADALIWMIENPVERLKMAERGRNHVLTAYSDEVIAPSHEAYLKEAINRCK